jgi:glycosyltransferase involved in cell wall biosynthesis
MNFKNNKPQAPTGNDTVDFTVAIPTYNGEARLSKLLERLKTQINTENFSWEIIVIDNNSSDRTASVIQSYQANWSQNYPLKYCLETQQGAAFARQRAIQEARSELIGFLDDDVLPAYDWVANAYQFGALHPQAGAYGGQIQAEFEVTPPENFERILPYFAVRGGEEPRLYRVDKFDFPPTAAVAIRKKAWCETVPTRPSLPGRVGKSMMAGDDYYVLRYIYNAGWQIWYTPCLQTYHQIPHWRMQRNYLLSIMHDGGLCTCYLKMLGVKNWQKPWVVVRTILANLYHATRHVVKYRRDVIKDPVTAAEMAFILSSLISPLYVSQLASSGYETNN